MDPTVVAAWIAAGVSVLTLVGTLAAQYFGRRLTARDADRAFAEQREQLDRTLDAQGRQLDRTLDGQRTRTWNERFATAAEQLGNDKPAVRLAGVYSMAGLADDWSENRQTCVDVLCAYLRMPYDPGSPQDPLMLQASREVRHTITRIITAHLLRDALVSWRGLKFDFTGAVFDTGGFRGAVFSDSWVYFTNARFSAGTVDFGEARFSGAQVDFFGAQFDGGTVNFSHAEFSAGWVGFRDAQFSAGTVDFNFAEFSGGGVDFGGAEFSDGLVDFGAAKFSTGWVSFCRRPLLRRDGQVRNCRYQRRRGLHPSSVQRRPNRFQRR